ncbi:MAG: DUF1989 domain-containing protein, partial [Pseudomonadota bacterium]
MRTFAAFKIPRSIICREGTEMIKESTRSPADTNRHDTCVAGDYYIQPVTQGEVIRIHDTEGNQAADTLFYSLADPS